MRWWDRRLNRTKKGDIMPARRLSDHYSFRLFVSFILALVLMFALLLVFSCKSGANIPRTGPSIEETIPDTAEPSPPTCQDFASAPKAERVQSWRRLFWNQLARTGPAKEVIECAIDYDRLSVFDDKLKVGCQSGGIFEEVFFAEVRFHLRPCGWDVRRNNP